MTAMIATGVLVAATTLGGLLLPLAVLLAAAVFAVLLVMSVRPVRRPPARIRLPHVAVALPVAQLAGADVAGLPRVTETVVVPADDERSA